MRIPTVFAAGDRELALGDLALPLALDDLLPGAEAAPWEVEIGVGKGRYLLSHAAADPRRRFLGVEVASKYYRLARRRSLRRGLKNLLLVRGEALFLLSSVLPRGFASALHVYHPDPWPKSRHARRRLFDPETVDLVLGVLRPGGELFFATDFIAYGERVEELLHGFPGLAVERRDAWPEGPRTNYEAKYVREGRPILRLQARLDPDAAVGRLHPLGARAIVAGARVEEEESAADGGATPGGPRPRRSVPSYR